jgi:Rho-binding antiterminator
MSNKFLKCDLHDYLEIACLYKFEVELLLSDGTNILAVPITTKTINKIEYLEVNSSDELITVPVLNLKSMRSCIENPYFDKVQFR